MIQETKLTSADAGAGSMLGSSVALSSDGNTAIVGGIGDGGSVGAAWVFTRSGGVWSQQAKLVGSGAIGTSQQGYSVALSADGNTAIIGGISDNSGVGAAWAFVRSGGVWTQQGSKLVGSGDIGASRQGIGVALSADGNTAIVGGDQDNSDVGAAWVYTRSGGVWTQQGSKLVSADTVGAARQGGAVALSADGNTAIVGGDQDNTNVGAVWVYTRSVGVWSQQGGKIVGSGAVGASRQGWAVGLSADGNTAIVGGYDDNSSAGAAWVFTRSVGVWSQQGGKIVGTGATGAAQQGASVGISADGNTAVVGGYGDDTAVGAMWVYTRTGGVWTQQGGKLVGTGAVGPAQQGVWVAISADGVTAISGGWTDNSGVGAAWVFVSSATQLAFGQQPTITSAGALMAPAVTVQLQDAGGNPVAVGGVIVTMALSSGTGTLSGTLSQVTNTSGLASFSDLSVNLIGAKQLTASCPGRASAVSISFTIMAAAPASIVATGGTPQTTVVGTAFGTALQATVHDGFGNPASGVTVTFTAPSSGASGAFGGFTTATATTNAAGIAIAPTLIANGTTGAFTVNASVAGVAAPASFALGNTSGAATSIAATGGTPQSTELMFPFPQRLSATVRDSFANPVPGVLVTFTVIAGALGAAGEFPGPAASATALTDATGVAVAPPITANSHDGLFVVTATAAGVSGSASFALEIAPAIPLVDAAGLLVLIAALAALGALALGTR